MRVAVSCAVLLLYRGAYADAVAYSCTGSSNITPITDGGGACIGFDAKDTKGHVVAHVRDAYRGNGTARATRDGRSVVFINSSPLEMGPDVDAIVMFRDGKLVARYSMKDVIARMDLVTESVSHVHWLRSSVSDQLGKTLEVETMSFRKLSFDVATGKQLSADDSDDWKRCDLIVYAAESVTASGTTYTLDHAWLAKGTLPGGSGSRLRFKAGPDIEIGSVSGKSLCLVTTKSGSFEVTKVFDGLMFNLLPR